MDTDRFKRVRPSGPAESATIYLPDCVPMTRPRRDISAGVSQGRCPGADGKRRLALAIVLASRHLAEGASTTLLHGRGIFAFVIHQESVGRCFETKGNNMPLPAQTEPLQPPVASSAEGPVRLAASDAAMIMSLPRQQRPRGLQGLKYFPSGLLGTKLADVGSRGWWTKAGGDESLSWLL